MSRVKIYRCVLCRGYWCNSYRASNNLKEKENMEKELEKVEITFSDGTHETYTKNVLVIALNGRGVDCRASFKCKMEEAAKVAIAVTVEAGRIFEQGVKQEEGGGANEVRLVEREGGDSFRDFMNSL